MKHLLSQSVNFGGQTITGPLVGENGPVSTIGELVTQVLKFLLPFAGVMLLFVFIWGGIDFMMSQGNAEKLKAAQAKITTGLIGFGLLVFSYLLVKLIAAIFGLQGAGII